MVGDSLTADLHASLVASRGNSFHLNISLDIDAGRTVALLGPNGAGKSTTVGLLAGLQPLDAGCISLGGRVLDDPDRGIFVPAAERRVGVVFQDYLLFPHLTVAENVAFGLEARLGRRQETRTLVMSWLQRLDLAELAERVPADLSGGQAQRAALARALATEPELLLLDEPLAALDVSARAQLRRVLIDHLGAFPGPRLLITHDPTEAFLLADEIRVIEDGAITQVGAADDIRLRPRTRYIADLAGINLVRGEAVRGVISVGQHRLITADTTAHGSVLATIQPQAISVHRHQPEGSARNVWPTRITSIEHYGDRVRLLTAEPLPLTVEVTPAAVAALRLGDETEVWLSIKATEIEAQVV